MSEQKLTGYPSIDKPWLKYYSDEAINAELPECSIYEYLWENNKNYLDKTALQYFGRKITFRELFENIDRAVEAFATIGVKSGDIVIMATVTTPETVYTLYALNKLGAIANMVDPRTSPVGIKEYIQEANAKVILALDTMIPKIAEAVIGTNIETIIVVSPADSLPGIKRVLFTITNKAKSDEQNFLGNCIPWTKFVQGRVCFAPASVSRKRNTCCVIVHTGGTTGSPKGVMLSDENVNALVLQSILTGIDMKREHTWMDIMPPFIAYGIGMGLHLPLVIGMETILIPAFDPKEFDKLLLKYKPIHMVGVPSHWGTIIDSKKLRKQDLSFIIAPTVGGDTMDMILEKNANEFLNKHGCQYPITKGYGMTEVCGGVSGTIAANNEIGSVGIPFVKSVISVFDLESGAELKYNEQGEICISGPNVMLGYYNDKAATNSIKRVHKDGSVWIHSGDIGYMTEDGSLYILDRVKRMIIRHDGFKVFPSLIEKVVATHPAIQACCVVGVPDKRHSQGRLPVVFAVLKSEYTGRERTVQEDVMELSKEKLPEYAQPIEIRFIKGIPATPIGKVDYRTLEAIAVQKEGAAE